MTVTDSKQADMTLERAVGLQLHAFSHMVAGTFYKRTEVPFGVSLSEWRVLQEAIVSPNTSQGQVAIEHGLNVMTVSRAVSGLVRKGLLIARHDPEDRRRRLLEPTPLGVELGAEMFERARLMYGHMFSTLSADELETLAATMAKVNAVIREGDFPELPPASQPWADILRESAADGTTNDTTNDTVET